MKAWRLEKLAGALTFEDLPRPKVRPHSVLIRMEAVPLLSYLKDYAGGKLPSYSAPAHKFTPGTNGLALLKRLAARSGSSKSASASCSRLIWWLPRMWTSRSKF